MAVADAVLLAPQDLIHSNAISIRVGRTATGRSAMLPAVGPQVDFQVIAATLFISGRRLNLDPFSHCNFVVSTIRQPRLKILRSDAWAGRGKC